MRPFSGHATPSARHWAREFAVPALLLQHTGKLVAWLRVTRTADDARALLLAGADKVAVNSAAVERPEVVGEIAARFGSELITEDGSLDRPALAPDRAPEPKPGAP